MDSNLGWILYAFIESWGTRKYQQVAITKKEQGKSKDSVAKKRVTSSKRACDSNHPNNKPSKQ